jgi:nitrate/TMAO reductase-like tetraheme cytochrome c subunit
MLFFVYLLQEKFYKLSNEIINQNQSDMKKFTKLFIAVGLFIAAGGFIFSSCTKEGPQGPAGTNASTTCQECHNFSDTIVAKIFQYNASKHATGSTLSEASNTACAPCHSSQGFTEVQLSSTGSFSTAGPINDAAPINCRTCHQIHKTYTSKDWSLATTSQYRWRFDSTQNQNFSASGGSANLCGRCHQARVASPALTKPSSTTDSITITSIRWGPHHGPQSNILAGKGAYNDALWDDSPHRNVASCIVCHGGHAVGNFVGGHTLLMTSTSIGDNVSVCNNTGCHNGATSFDIGSAQSTIFGKYSQLKGLLAAANMLDTNTMLIKPKKYAQADLAVFWNFMLIDADRSMGVHNYLYCLGLLNDGINHFGGKAN